MIVYTIKPFGHCNASWETRVSNPIHWLITIFPIKFAVTWSEIPISYCWYLLVIWLVIYIYINSCLFNHCRFVWPSLQLLMLMLHSPQFVAETRDFWFPKSPISHGFWSYPASCLLLTRYIKISPWIWAKQCYKPSMTGNGNHTTYILMVIFLGDGLWL